MVSGDRGPRLSGHARPAGLVLDAGLSPDGVRAAVAAAGAARRHEVVVYLPCGAGHGARRRLESELDPSRGAGPTRVAVGSPSDVADTVRSFAAAGATTVVLQPAGDDPDLASTLRLAAEARGRLLRPVEGRRQH